MPLADFLKRAAVRALPAPVLEVLRRVHHARALRSPDLSAEPDLAVVRALVHEGDVVLDAGANVGLYTSVLARWVGATGIVHAVEPVPETHRVLRYVVARLGARNVRLHECALLDRVGTSFMVVPALARGEGHYFAHVVAAGGAPDRFVVRTATVDALLADDAARVTFIKCDVEGVELDVMRGAGALLRRATPALLIEVSGDPDEPGSTAATLFDELGRLGYESWWYDGAHLRRRGGGDRSVNYFFLTPAHRATLAEQAPALLATPASPPRSGA